MNEEELKKLKELHSSGLVDKEIAFELGTCASNICNYRMKLGLIAVFRPKIKTVDGCKESAKHRLIHKQLDSFKNKDKIKIQKRLNQPHYTRYMQEYRLLNPSKMKMLAKRNYEKHKNTTRKEYVERNKDKIKKWKDVYNKKYYAKNKEKILLQYKEYHSRPEVKQHRKEYNKERWLKNKNIGLPENG